MCQTSKDAFAWSDDEVKVLLSCVRRPKMPSFGLTTKSSFFCRVSTTTKRIWLLGACIDWETVHLKSVVIRLMFLKCIEAVIRDGSTNSKEYKHGEDDLTKDCGIGDEEHPR